MIEERARVNACDGRFALVEVQRGNSCGHCQLQNGCGTSLLARFFGRRRNLVRVLNPVDAKPGDMVVIGLEESALTAASATLYLLPIVALLAAAVAGQMLARSLGLVATEPLSLLGGLLGLAAGLFVAGRRARRVQHDQRHQAVILRSAPASHTGTRVILQSR